MHHNNTINKYKKKCYIYLSSRLVFSRFCSSYDIQGLAFQHKFVKGVDKEAEVSFKDKHALRETSYSENWSIQVKYYFLYAISIN